MNLYKQALAQFIYDNGGWISDGRYAAQDKDDSTIWFSNEKPTRRKGQNYWVGDKRDGITCDRVLSNWFCVILSRDEYFRLYPAPDADGWIEWKGGNCPVDDDVIVDVKTRDGEVDVNTAYFWNWSHEQDLCVHHRQITAYRLHEPAQSVEPICADAVAEAPEHVWTNPPTIEQLAAEYRSRKDYAERKQQEADAAKDDAEAKLSELVAAGKALGLVLSVVAPEPELVITDWRDLQVGDVVEVTGSDNPGWIRLKGVESVVTSVGTCGDDVAFCPRNDDTDWAMSDNTEWRFIRRPAKGDANA